jgi:hypothetical protein
VQGEPTVVPETQTLGGADGQTAIAVPVQNLKDLSGFGVSGAVLQHKWQVARDGLDRRGGRSGLGGGESARPRSDVVTSSPARCASVVRSKRTS